MTCATEKWENCVFVVMLQALILCGHKVPDMKPNTGPEIIFEGISFTREEDTFSSGGIFFKNSGCMKYPGGTQCLKFCEMKKNIQ